MLVDTIAILPGSGNTVGGIPREKTLTMPGELVAVTGHAKWFLPVNIRITSITARVSDASSGSPIRLAVKKNNTQITVDTVDIQEGSYVTTVTVPDINDADGNVGDYYTVDLIQVGSVVKGSDLTVQINYVTVSV